MRLKSSGLDARVSFDASCGRGECVSNACQIIDAAASMICKGCGFFFLMEAGLGMRVVPVIKVVFVLRNGLILRRFRPHEKLEDVSANSAFLLINPALTHPHRTSNWI
jgi:hypothetical protein